MTVLVHAAAALASPDFLVASSGPAIGFIAGALAGRALRRRVPLVDSRGALGILTLGLLCLVLGAVALLIGVPFLALHPVASAGFGVGQLLGMAGGVGLSGGISLLRAVRRDGRRSAGRLIVGVGRI